MRLLALTFGITALGLSGLFATTLAHARGPWCAHYPEPDGSIDCSFYSFGQCQATVHGTNGICERLPYSYYSDEDDDYRYRPHHHHHHHHHYDD